MNIKNTLVKSIQTAFLASIIAIAITAEASEGKISFGVDGSIWKRTLGNEDSQTAQLQKLILLRGILDGMMFGQSPFMASKSNAVYTNTTYEHLIDALDQFYSDYRNEKIFVVWALLIVSMELNGEPKGKIEATLAEYRRRISAIR